MQPGDNPFFSAWLASAKAWTEAVNSFWSTALRHPQSAMLNEPARRMLRIWSGGILRDTAAPPAQTATPQPPQTASVEPSKAPPEPEVMPMGAASMAAPDPGPAKPVPPPTTAGRSIRGAAAATSRVPRRSAASAPADRKPGKR